MDKYIIITPQEFADQMREIAEDTDKEGRHSDADDLMCVILRSLGYEEGIDIYLEMSKWYA